jgi:hypothetical protein
MGWENAALLVPSSSQTNDLTAEGPTPPQSGKPPHDSPGVRLPKLFHAGIAEDRLHTIPVLLPDAALGALCLRNVSFQE